jgi:acyl carrier protein
MTTSFLLGGDSLISLRVIHGLEQQLDLELSPTLLFRQPICTIWLRIWPHFWPKGAGA